MTPSSAPRLKHLNNMRRPVVGRSIAWLVGFCVLLVGIHAWSLWASREAQLAETTASTTNMARALAAHAEASLKLADAILAETVERVQVDGLDGREGQRLRARFLDIRAAAPGVHGLFVFDADGKWRTTSLAVEQRGNNADREYFVFHRTHAGTEARVGKPVRSRSTGVLVIPVTRRIDRADGSFGGVALVTLDLSYFGSFYDRFDVGHSGTIVLATDDGTLIYRRPFKESLVGTDISKGPVFQVMRTSGPSGSAMLRAKIDGIERLYSYRHLEGYPLLVASAQAKDEILGDWWTAVIKMSVVVLFAIIVLAGGGAYMIRQIRIREKLEAELLLAGASLQQHNQSLKTLAESDGLTGLANRRLFEATLEREVGRARRSGSSFALILADVDYFKKYNDRYGHVAGDVCLRRVAGAIASGARRPTDLVARYGGEEFALILPDTDLEGAMAVAELIRAAVADMGIAHADCQGGRLTLSLGVAAGAPAQEPDSAIHTWVEAADAALYDAKAKGRNGAVGRVGSRLAA